MATILERALQRLNVDPRPYTLSALRAELNSRIRDRRVTALMRIRRQIEMKGLRQSYFDLVRGHIQERDSTCRWQATIVIGEFIEKDPEQVWPIALELAKSANPDIRMASTRVLLEHLLEYHPRTMVPRFKAELTNGNRRFKKAVASCGNFGDSRSRARIQKVIDAAKAV